MAALEALLPLPQGSDPSLTPPLTPAAGPAAGPRSADGPLVGTYAYMAVMETLGFARFFRDPVVAVVGGLGMLPIAGTAVVHRMRG
jgi:putative membrane protein